METGKGHGTVLSGSSAQGNARVYVISNGGNSAFEAGVEYDVVNATDQTISPGEIVYLDLNASSSLEAYGVGARGRCNLNEDGNMATITDAGDTGLSGTIAVNFNYGDNEGWGGATDVAISNVSGEAAYLGDA